MSAKERWRPVPGVDLEASTLGRIRGGPYTYTNGPKPRQVSICTYGHRIGAGVDQRYLRITWRRKNYLVHRLIALAFHGAPPKGHECMHLNEDVFDNRPENLKWGTHQENCSAPKYRAEISAQSKKRARDDPDFFRELSKAGNSAQRRKGNALVESVR